MKKKIKTGKKCNASDYEWAEEMYWLTPYLKSTEASGVPKRSWHEGEYGKSLDSFSHA